MFDVGEIDEDDLLFAAFGGHASDISSVSCSNEGGRAMLNDSSKATPGGQAGARRFSFKRKSPNTTYSFGGDETHLPSSKAISPMGESQLINRSATSGSYMVQQVASRGIRGECENNQASNHVILNANQSVYDYSKVVTENDHNGNGALTLVNNAAARAMAKTMNLNLDSRGTKHLGRETINFKMQKDLPSTTSNLFSLGAEEDLDFDLSSFDDPMEDEGDTKLASERVSLGHEGMPTLSHFPSGGLQKELNTNLSESSSLQTPFAVSNQRTFASQVNQLNPSRPTLHAGMRSPTKDHRLISTPSTSCTLSNVEHSSVTSTPKTVHSAISRLRQATCSNNAIRNCTPLSSRGPTTYVARSCITPTSGPSTPVQSHRNTNQAGSSFPDSGYVNVTETPKSNRNVSPSNQSPWDSFSVNNSSLCETPLGTKRSGRVKRKFPGPAGALPKLDDKANIDGIQDLRPHSPVVAVSKSGAEQEVPQSQLSQSTTNPFSMEPWTVMLKDLSEDSREVTSVMTKYNISNLLQLATKKKLTTGKVPVLCVIIDSVSIHGAEASAVFKDPTGMISGTLHRQLAHDYQIQLQAGAALVLKQVGVFSPSGRTHYLNVTPNNLVQIYSIVSGKLDCTLVGTEKLQLKHLKQFEATASPRLEHLVDSSSPIARSQNHNNSNTNLSTPNISSKPSLFSSSISTQKRTPCAIQNPNRFQQSKQLSNSKQPRLSIGNKGDDPGSQIMTPKRFSIVNGVRPNSVVVQQSTGVKAQENGKGSSTSDGMTKGLQEEFEDSWLEDNLDDVLSGLDEGML